jgi:hypothetical protein
MNITTEKLDKAINFLKCETAAPHQHRWADIVVWKYLNTTIFPVGVHPFETDEWRALSDFYFSKMKPMSEEDYREVLSDEWTID